MQARRALRTDSFWTGVDVPGDASSQWVIATGCRSARPTASRSEAKSELIRERGGDASMNHSARGPYQVQAGRGPAHPHQGRQGPHTVLDSRILANPTVAFSLPAFPSRFSPGSPARTGTSNFVLSHDGWHRIVTFPHDEPSARLLLGYRQGPEGNEDRYLFEESPQLFGVADGVGGLPGGAEARPGGGGDRHGGGWLATPAPG